MFTTRRIGVVGLVATIALIGLITLTPQGNDSAHGKVSQTILGLLHKAGVPDTFSYVQWEITANVIMFLPFGFFLALAFWGSGRWFLLGLPSALSAVIEGSQHLFLPSRYPTVSDLLANSAGGIVGLGVGVTLLWLLRRSRKIGFEQNRRSNLTGC